MFAATSCIHWNSLVLQGVPFRRDNKSQQQAVYTRTLQSWGSHSDGTANLSNKLYTLALFSLAGGPPIPMGQQSSNKLYTLALFSLAGGGGVPFRWDNKSWQQADTLVLFSLAGGPIPMGQHKSQQQAVYTRTLAGISCNTMRQS